MSATPGTPFHEAVKKLVTSPEWNRSHPDGFDSKMVLEALDPQFPLCTVLDVHDELTYILGPPR